MLFWSFSLFSLVFISYWNLFSLILFFYLLLFILFSSYYFNYSFFNFFYIDEIYLFMNCMLLLVLFFSFFFCFSKFSVVFVMILMCFCFMVFSTSNLFFLYLFYELSIVPIIYIIVVWGVYSDRSISSLMLFVYTSIFTLPFMFILFFLYYSCGSFNYIMVSSFFSFFYFSPFYSIIIFMVFAVKLPIYGFHYWLPMAHVEAPTFGSMILAGVLLKLGGVGLLRFSFLFDLDFMFSYFFGYFALMFLYLPFLCCQQSDFKRLVAYSSVSHMMFVPLLILVFNPLSLKSLYMLFLFHGISSPILFSIVGFLNSIYHTRQMVLMRGAFYFSPLISVVMIFSCFFSVSVPPFPSFICEVFMFCSLIYLSNIMVFFLVIFSLLSMVYNMMWLGTLLYFPFSSSFISYQNTFFSFKIFFSMFIALFFGLTFIFSFFYF